MKKSKRLKKWLKQRNKIISDHKNAVAKARNTDSFISKKAAKNRYDYEKLFY